MTRKQKIFADEYLIDLNATRAYKVAYPSVKNDEVARAAASRLLTNVNVQKYIDSRLKEIHNEKTADAQEVVEYLTSVLRGESKSSVLARDEIGAERVIEKPPDEKERLKAAELLGKRYGLLKEAVDLEVKASEKLADVMAQIGGDGLEE